MVLSLMFYLFCGDLMVKLLGFWETRGAAPSMHLKISLQAIRQCFDQSEEYKGRRIQTSGANQ